MKFQRLNFPRRTGCGLGAAKQSEGGSAVLVFIALLAIMVILATANSKALFHLHQEIKLLEHRQLERLNVSQTNAVAIAASPAKPGTK
jgi:hypothetical protein